MKWMATGVFAWSLCLLLGVLIGTGGYTFYYANGAAYLSNDPAACINCHIMREHFNAWQKASHHGVATCNDCHLSHHPIGKWVTKADNGFRHSWAFTFQNFHEPIQIHPRGKRVLEDNCLRCHGELVAQIKAADQFHNESLDCLRCHDDVGHGP